VEGPDFHSRVPLNFQGDPNKEIGEHEVLVFEGEAIAPIDKFGSATLFLEVKGERVDARILKEENRTVDQLVVINVQTQRLNQKIFEFVQHVQGESISLEKIEELVEKIKALMAETEQLFRRTLRIQNKPLRDQAIVGITEVKAKAQNMMEILRESYGKPNLKNE